MVNWGYTFSQRLAGLDKDHIAIACGRDLHVSPKKTREVTNTIKGMTLTQAKQFLEQVIALKQAVPFRRYRTKGSHQTSLKRFGWHSGRYPEKSARIVYEILENAEANAEEKGLDLERVSILHAATLRGRYIKRFIERAHGRSSAFFKQLSHVEIILNEKE